MSNYYCPIKSDVESCYDRWTELLDRGERRAIVHVYFENGAVAERSSLVASIFPLPVSLRPLVVVVGKDTGRGKMVASSELLTLPRTVVALPVRPTHHYHLTGEATTVFGRVSTAQVPRVGGWMP